MQRMLRGIIKDTKEQIAMTSEIHLFVQEGCRPCIYAETQLKKVEGWEKVVTITNAKEEGTWSQFAKDCGVTATPTLIGIQNGEVVAKLEGSQQMTTEFWTATVSKHSPLPDGVTVKPGGHWHVTGGAQILIK
jgi:hypothetical protein